MNLWRLVSGRPGVAQAALRGESRKLGFEDGHMATKKDSEVVRVSRVRQLWLAREPKQRTGNDVLIFLRMAGAALTRIAQARKRGPIPATGGGAEGTCGRRVTSALVMPVLLTAGPAARASHRLPDDRETDSSN